LVWSDHLYEMCGVERESFQPSFETIRPGVHRDDWDRWYRALKTAASKGTVFEEEQRIYRTDGDMRHFYTRAEPMFDDAGEVVMLVGVSRDITRRKRIEMARHELELQVRQLQRLEAIGTLAGGIAHDFNNILGATMGYTDMALMELEEEHPAYECLQEIEKASLRAKDLVNQILGFSRHIERERETLVLEGVVREALGLMRASLPANIEIQERLRARDVKVHCDGSQVHQVVVNLCTNASHAMPEGGVLRVELDHIRCSEPMAMAAGELSPGSYARLSLTDDGHGMDEGTRQRIFEPFFTTKESDQGTGLGLSTVQGIVLDHQGGIVVRSRPGEGTTFEVYLPVDDRAAPVQAQPVRITPEGHRETVLFLDDEVSLMGLGEKMLGRLGYRAMAFNSAIAALDVFRRDPERFDLVITDLRMPEMSGLDVAQEMRQIRPNIPIVLTTGYSDPKLEEHVANGLVQGTLLKPFNLAAIGDCVGRALGGTKPKSSEKAVRKRSSSSRSRLDGGSPSTDVN
jgi:PAS domain S-box-containing protein